MQKSHMLPGDLGWSIWQISECMTDVVRAHLYNTKWIQLKECLNEEAGFSGVVLCGGSFISQMPT